MHNPVLSLGRTFDKSSGGHLGRRQRAGALLVASLFASGVVQLPSSPVAATGLGTQDPSVTEVGLRAPIATLTAAGSRAATRPRLAVDNDTVFEGDDAKFELRLSKSSRRWVTVHFFTEDGSARGGSDYEELAGSRSCAQAAGSPRSAWRRSRTGAARGTRPSSSTCSGSEGRPWSTPLAGPPSSTVRAYPAVSPSLQPAVSPSLPTRRATRTARRRVPRTARRRASRTARRRARPTARRRASRTARRRASRTARPRASRTAHPVPAQLPTPVPAQLPTAVRAQLPTAVPAELPAAVPAQLPTAVRTELPATDATEP